MKKRMLAVFCLCLITLQCTGCAQLIAFFGLDELTSAPVTEPPSTTAPDQTASTEAPTLPIVTPTVPPIETNATLPPPPTTLPTEPTESEPSETEAPETTGPAPVTNENGERIVGTTSKGYRIVERDGLTYINGVLIVNKTYGVPQDYDPGDLTAECAEAFSELQAAAADDGLNIFLLSGYRSYELQTSLYERYCARDGQAAADTYSARPGHSEHQTGLAIDVNSLSYSFADTEEGRWLAANAHLFGFIIRYSQDKQAVTGYSYEPWHIRYLGRAVAQAVYESGLCLEEYFGITSVYS